MLPEECTRPRRGGPAGEDCGQPVEPLRTTMRAPKYVRRSRVRACVSPLRSANRWGCWSLASRACWVAATAPAEQGSRRPARPRRLRKILYSRRLRTLVRKSARGQVRSHAAKLESIEAAYCRAGFAERRGAPVRSIAAPMPEPLAGWGDVLGRPRYPRARSVLRRPRGGPSICGGPPRRRRPTRARAHAGEHRARRRARGSCRREGPSRVVGFPKMTRI